MKLYALGVWVLSGYTFPKVDGDKNSYNTIKLYKSGISIKKIKLFNDGNIMPIIIKARMLSVYLINRHCTARLAIH
jgi:hypothetical protein